MPMTPELARISLQRKPGRFALHPSSRWEENEEASWGQVPPAAKGRSRAVRLPRAVTCCHRLQSQGALEMSLGTQGEKTPRCGQVISAFT